MLNDIRKMILERKEFQEAAEIIFEDGMGNLDDQIVLGEENNPDTNPPVQNDEEDDLDNGTIGTPEDEDDSEGGDSETPAPESEPETNPEPGPEPTPSVEPTDDGTPMPLPTGDDELPTPVGKQTGEPISDPDDLLDVSIDLKSNTIRDVLPVPPANAAEALGGDDDDLLNQRIDSGFGGENPEESTPTEPEVDMTPAQPPENPSSEGDETPTDTPDEPTEESQLTEAITLGNDAPAGDDSTPAADAPPADDSTPPDDGTEPPAEENPVTAAVKDKVDEITDDAGGEGSASKDDLLKKLGNITKSLEDAKKAVMNTLQ